MKPLKPEIYDPLKFFTQIVLPALGTLYFALAGIWGLPAAEEVVGTIVALDAFLGVVLQLSSSAYSKDDNMEGIMNVIKAPDGRKTFALHLNSDPHNLEDADVIRFKVNQTEAVTME